MSHDLRTPLTGIYGASSTMAEELVGSALSKFSRRYPAAEVETSLPEALILISADPMLLEQVLINLLENAVQHAAGMTFLLLKVFLEGQNVVFEVLDDGCGISQDRLKNIFSGSPAGTEAISDRQKRNMGIGLSLCATIIKAHGGTIYARARSPQGMCFGFSLKAEEVIYE